MQGTPLRGGMNKVQLKDIIFRSLLVRGIPQQSVFPGNSRHFESQYHCLGAIGCQVGYTLAERFFLHCNNLRSAKESQQVLNLEHRSQDPDFMCGVTSVPNSLRTRIDGVHGAVWSRSTLRRTLNNLFSTVVDL